MKNAAPDIRLHFLKPVTLRDRRKLKAFIIRLFKKHRLEVASLNIIFCSDGYLLDINRQYLQHDYYTDIITFDLSAPAEPVVGELYISVDRVKDNALNAGLPFSTELLRVIFHGLLHLCGFRDKSAAEIAEIRAQEDAALSAFKRST